MGIDVGADRRVTFNPNHEQRVATDPGRPIPQFKAGAMPVVSVFRRQKSGQDNHDGNPLIFALKHRRGYSIERSDFREILSRGRRIVPAALALLPAYDLVVPLPSSSPITRLLGRHVARQPPASAILECLEKATVGGVLAMAPAPAQVAPKLRRDYTSLLNTWQSLAPNSLVEMKEVRQSLRPLVSPILATAAAAACAGRRVLLIDDIYGTGSSLLSARNALAPFGPAEVSALTLLSRLR